METAAFLVFSFAVSLIPYRVGLWLGGMTGRLFFLLLKRRRKIAIDNIRASLPFLQGQPGWDPVHGTPETIARRVFENLGRCLVEDCRIYHGRGGRMIDTVRFEGLEHYEMALAKGKGVAFITAHCGNWDLMALSFGARHREISVVARRQDNAYLNRVLEKIRSGYGNRVIYKQGALRAMIGEFRKNNIVGVLVDQAVIPEDGILVEFLGRNCWATRLPVVLARKTGVPLIPVFGHREGETHVVQFFPEVQLGLEERQDTDSVDMARVFAPLEDYIVRYPDQWYWIHNRWKRAPQS
nr:lysophospholipid acyltransferase family protein [Geotalea sp. SG265]